MSTVGGKIDAGRACAPSLALFGRAPAFTEPLRVGRPNVVDEARVLERIADALDRRWLTNEGPLVREFEAALAAMAGVEHCVTVANATVGLELTTLALGLTGEVIVPSWTFVAGPHALARGGTRPVFADVDPVTHCLDPASVERLITPDTSGILAVHLWGRAGAVDELASLADAHEIALFYDAAHAVASRHGGVPLGGHGRASVFSFHATKMVTAFEGGAITTDDDEVAEAVRRARNFGFAGEDRVIGAGTNAKMSEASAAMGLTSLEAVDRLLARNHQNHAAYRAGLKDTPGVEIPSMADDHELNHHYVVVEVDEQAAGLSRDEIVAVLRLEGVEARRYFTPGCHRQEPYATTDPGAGAHLPVTEALAERVFVLPTGLAVTPEAAATVSSVIDRAVAGAEVVRPALATISPERTREFSRP